MIYVIGVGPGDPEYITVKGLKIMLSCDVVAGWESVLSRFREHLVGKTVIKLTYRDEMRLLSEIVRLSLQGKRVAVLVNGDPSVSDWQLLQKIRKLCAESNVRLKIVSGVSCVNVILAREGLDLAHASLVTLHARGEVDMEEIVRHVKLGRAVIVFPRPHPSGPQEVARFLLRRGLRCRVRVYENVTLESERVSEYDLESLADERREFSDLTALVIYCDRSPS